ncbi:ROK family protein [Candidatus Avelusimicrobium faecicola]|uniref:ROK family protein n=1 Tax=Candidatus Avelusimicrobium faecicola TaxID=3416205 RepID=UPI002A67902A|nr:ROK family protein [Spirochaetota bacterium]MCI7536140.1 ROK family protein [Spirochaetota bacterium]MDE3276960.1 ROK family protein [Spirochaetota bacterium]MDY2939512.1 ROK family protein [Elusimicrobiaceae bacterium]MDY6128715.1 ROK family protein [Elusimicrobiaceae bacterium]
MIGIGVDIGGTFVKVFVMNEYGEIFRQEKMETDYSKGSQFFLQQLADYINRIQQEFAGQKVAVAVGAPGDVDNQNGILRYNPNLKFKDVADWPMARILKDLTGILPAVANDATLAAWGVYEKELNRKGNNVLVVTLGTGVGGGLIINRELYQGSNGTAGEIGHTKIADTRTGPLCGCGAHGCLEAFVGTIGIKRRVWQAAEEQPQSTLAQMVRQEKDFKIELVSRAAEKGCPAALKVWQDTGFYLGIGIANVVLTLDIDTVVLAGGVSRAATYFMPALKQVLENQQIKTPFKRLTLLTSTHPNIGGIGAAMYAIHQATKNA